MPTWESAARFSSRRRKAGARGSRCFYAILINVRTVLTHNSHLAKCRPKE
jgi:hypothetical protein